MKPNNPQKILISALLVILLLGAGSALLYAIKQQHQAQIEQALIGILDKGTYPLGQHISVGMDDHYLIKQTILGADIQLSGLINIYDTAYHLPLIAQVRAKQLVVVIDHERLEDGRVKQQIEAIWPGQDQPIKLTARLFPDGFDATLTTQQGVLAREDTQYSPDYAFSALVGQNTLNLRHREDQHGKTLAFDADIARLQLSAMMAGDVFALDLNHLKSDLAIVNPISLTIKPSDPTDGLRQQMPIQIAQSLQLQLSAQGIAYASYTDKLRQTKIENLVLSGHLLNNPHEGLSLLAHYASDSDLLQTFGMKYDQVQFSINMASNYVSPEIALSILNSLIQQTPQTNAGLVAKLDGMRLGAGVGGRIAPSLDYDKLSLALTLHTATLDDKSRLLDVFYQADGVVAIDADAQSIKNNTGPLALGILSILSNHKNDQGEPIINTHDRMQGEIPIKRLPQILGQALTQ